MTQMPDTYQGYDQFYLKGQPLTAERLKKYHRNYHKQFGPLLQGSRERTILDIGCASGMLCGYLANQGFSQVVGLDHNAELIRQAQNQVKAEFIHGDAGVFFNAGRRADIVFMLNVVEHIDRPALVQLMTQLYQGLNPGGFVVIRTPNMNHLLSSAHLADDFTHITGLNEQSLTQLAHLAGFSNVNMLNQFKMQNFKGKTKAILAYPLHKYLFWLRGGSKPKVFYRNLYAQLLK